VPFSSDPRRAEPLAASKFIAGIMENLFESTLVGSRQEEHAHRLVKSCTSRLGRLPTTHHIKRHGVRNKLPALTPNLKCILDVYQIDYTIAGLSRSRLAKRPPDTSRKCISRYEYQSCR
jgi:hypothetical protein